MAVVKVVECNLETAKKVFEELIQEGFKYPRILRDNLYIYNQPKGGDSVKIVSDDDPRELLEVFKSVKGKLEEEDSEKPSRSNLGFSSLFEIEVFKHGGIIDGEKPTFQFSI